MSDGLWSGKAAEITPHQRMLGPDILKAGLCPGILGFTQPLGHKFQGRPGGSDSAALPANLAGEV